VAMAAMVSMEPIRLPWNPFLGPMTPMAQDLSVQEPSQK